MSVWDTLPEDMTYADRGCVIHPRCLTCPLAVCAYEGKQVSPRAEKTSLRVLSYLEDGATVREITAATGLSRRQVYRTKARIGARFVPVEVAEA